MEKLRLPLLILLLLAILAGGLLLIQRQAGPGQALEISLNSPPPEVVVQISGEVVKPGVYKIRLGSRVSDLVEAAGGFTPEADGQAVNLAQKLKDGERIHIYRLGELPQKININAAEAVLAQ